VGHKPTGNTNWKQLANTTRINRHRLSQHAVGLSQLHPQQHIHQFTQFTRNPLRGVDPMCFSGSGPPTHFLRWIVYYCVCIQHDTDKSQISFINSWPSFSLYLYNRVWGELTCRNSLSHSRLACSRSWIKLVRQLSTVEYATLVYSTVDSGLTITWIM